MENTTFKKTELFYETYLCHGCGMHMELQWVPGEDKDILFDKLVGVHMDEDRCCDPRLEQKREGEDVIHFVNLYHIRDAYGGPEEGGWNYIAGTPLGSIPVRAVYRMSPYYQGDTLRPVVTDVDVEFAKAYLAKIFDFDHTNPPKFLRFYTESHMAREFPEHRPHYE